MMKKFRLRRDTPHIIVVRLFVKFHEGIASNEEFIMGKKSGLCDPSMWGNQHYDLPPLKKILFSKYIILNVHFHKVNVNVVNYGYHKVRLRILNFYVKLCILRVLALYI